MSYDVHLENFSFSPPRRREKGVLNNISFSVEKGEFLTIVGRNGQGKTTILRAISGELKNYTQGTVRVGAYEISGPVHKLASGVGIVHQFVQDDLIDNLSIARNIQIRQLFSTDKAIRLTAIDPNFEARLNEQLNTHIDIDITIDTLVRKLSGGQKQLLNVLIAINFEHSTGGGCKLLLLDEHLTSLDVIIQKKVMKLIDSLTRPTKNKPRKTTVIMVTHDLEYAIEYSDNILILDLGEIKEIISKAQKSKWTIDYLISRMFDD